jgi:hypothetical protein
MTPNDMAGDKPSEDPWEDDDEEANVADESVLDALGSYVPPGDAEDLDDRWDLPGPPGSHGDEEFLTVLFTATNPTETVSVTALMDGRVLNVELSPRVASMTESQLAEEILVIAGLARQQAQAGQHALIADLMGQLGQDPASTRSFLERDLRLPSPETVKSERSSIFAARYADD